MEMYPKKCPDWCLYPIAQFPGFHCTRQYPAQEYRAYIRSGEDSFVANKVDSKEQYTREPNTQPIGAHLMQGLQADVSCVTKAMQCGNVCSVQSIAQTDSGQIKITL